VNSPLGSKKWRLAGKNIPSNPVSASLTLTAYGFAQ
jgi:hypothetical protein